VIHLDTSVLIDAFTGPCASEVALRGAIAGGEPVTFSAIAGFEWYRGPRTRDELAAQEAVCPAGAMMAFGLAEAKLAAELYRRVKNPRGRHVDLAIAAAAIVHGARLWTLNRRDFADIPRLQLY
jgi:predicted nucleic acid-binding protein